MDCGEQEKKCVQKLLLFFFTLLVSHLFSFLHKRNLPFFLQHFFSHFFRGKNDQRARCGFSSFPFFCYLALDTRTRINPFLLTTSLQPNKLLVFFFWKLHCALILWFFFKPEGGKNSLPMKGGGKTFSVGNGELLSQRIKVHINVVFSL